MSSVVADREEKLGVDEMDGSNLSAILMRSESLPYVLMILTVLVGELEGASVELLERLQRIFEDTFHFQDFIRDIVDHGSRIIGAFKCNFKFRDALF